MNEDPRMIAVGRDHAPVCVGSVSSARWLRFVERAWLRFVETAGPGIPESSALESYLPSALSALSMRRACIPQSVWHHWVISLKPASVVDAKIVKDRLRLSRSVRDCFSQHGTAASRPAPGAASRQELFVQRRHIPGVSTRVMTVARALWTPLVTGRSKGAKGARTTASSLWRIVLPLKRHVSLEASGPFEERRLQALRVCNLR